MNNPFLKVVLFVIVVVAIFVYIGEALTGLSGSGSGGGVAGEISATLGESIFFGKGKCYTCHAFGSEGSAVRCPNLGVMGDRFTEPVGMRAARRRADQGMSAVRYLVESLYNPNAYVVEGYPRNLMTPINRPPIALGDDEIASVILYLLAKSEVGAGETLLAEIQAAQAPFASGTAVVAAGGAEFEFPPGDAEEGRYTFEDYRCFQCHKVEGLEFQAGYEGGVGPDLTSIGSIQTRTYIVESILEPDRVIVADPPGQNAGGEGSYRTAGGASKMPEYHDAMTLRELLDIGAFLETLKDRDENARTYGDGG